MGQEGNEDPICDSAGKITDSPEGKTAGPNFKKEVLETLNQNMGVTQPGGQWNDDMVQEIYKQKYHRTPHGKQEDSDLKDNSSISWVQNLNKGPKFVRKQSP